MRDYFEAVKNLCNHSPKSDGIIRDFVLAKLQTLRLIQ